MGPLAPAPLRSRFARPGAGGQNLTHPATMRAGLRVDDICALFLEIYCMFLTSGVGCLEAPGVADDGHPRRQKGLLMELLVVAIVAIVGAGLVFRHRRTRTAR
jgi:hypothetical protein